LYPYASLNYKEETVKFKLTLFILVFLAVLTPVVLQANTNALRREIVHIEAAADNLMRLTLDVQNRTLRRRIAAEVDELYEAAERMRLLITDDDTIPKPIRDEDLEVFVQVLKEASFSDTKVDMIREFASSNWFTVVQVGVIAEQVAFGDDKVDAILALYPHIVDPQNSYRLYEYVSFSDDRERLKQGLAELQGD
jgi:hypothetical protein